MRQASREGEIPVAVATTSVGAGQSDGTIALQRPAPFGARLALPRLGLASPLTLLGWLALAVLVASCAAVVVFATAGPSVLVPRSLISFPGWMSGPLNGLFGSLSTDATTLGNGWSVVMVVMAIAYAAALVSASALSMRVITAAGLALAAILVLSPPLALTDMFNYLGYARLGSVHGLNPYTHVIAFEPADPIYRFATWKHLLSPYGPAFTLGTYATAGLSIAAAYWVIKAAVVCAAVGLVALVARIARQLGRDPRFAVLFVGANPLFLLYTVGAFHNDVFMLLPALAAVSLMLDGRDTAAGAALAVAVAVKFNALLLLPFLLIAPGSLRRGLRLAAGAALAGGPLAAASIAAFGIAVPNLADQSSLLTAFSVPNVIGTVLGTGGGTHSVLMIGDVALVVVVAVLLVRRRDWLSGAGWATLALLASLAWLMPWYITWVLPFAAVGSSVRLRRAALAFTLFLIIAFVPVTYRWGFAPVNVPAYLASHDRQMQLEK